jgi:DNA-binding NarL/FixJ family response regulator
VEDANQLNILSPREMQVASFVVKSYGAKEIAAELELSPYTVGRYLCTIYAKLAIHSRVELALWVIRQERRGILIR